MLRQLLPEGVSGNSGLLTNGRVVITDKKLRQLIDDNPHTVALPDVLDWMEWPVNCFLKAFGENLYLGQLATCWPVRNNLKLEK